MPQQQQHIHCTVNNCHYWVAGNKCIANEIIVVNDAFGAQQPDHIGAGEAKQIEATPADNCMDTCCKTFVPKNSNKVKADNVYKMQQQ